LEEAMGQAAQGGEAGTTAAAPGAAVGCPSCGMVMPAGARFCIGCGHRLDAPPTGAPPTGAPPPAAPPPAAPTAAGAPPLVAPAPAPAWPLPRPKTPWLIAAAVILVALVVAIVNSGGDDAAGGSAQSPTTYHLTGTLSAPSCDGGYAIENANVFVRNQANELIGSTTSSSDNSSGYDCEVSFAVDVPSATFYTVKVGTHEGPAWSFQELSARNWQIDLSLGS
jgi:zinc ribbon protein